MRAARPLKAAGPLCLVALGAVYVAWLGFRLETTGDYASTFAPAMNALLAGHLGEFFRTLPDDGAGGSILLRAPGAAVGKLLGGGQLSTFRFGTLECVLALGIVGIVLTRGRGAATTQTGRWLVIGLCVLSPAALDVVLFGHPEEALGAALCVAGVLLAASGRPALAGLAVGLAVINKPWGVLALVPCLLAAEPGRRRLLAAALAMAGGWFAAAYFAAPSAFAQSLSALSVVAHPQELWWPLAHLRAVPGVTPAYFLPPFLADHSREFAVLLAVPLSLPLMRRSERRESDCLALLAMLFLVRCLLDPSNHVYYHLPLVIAIVAWEARTHSVPRLAPAALAAIWVAFNVNLGTGGQFAFYLCAVAGSALVLADPVLGLRPRIAQLTLGGGRAASAA